MTDKWLDLATELKKCETWFQLEGSTGKEREREREIELGIRESTETMQTIKTPALLKRAKIF